MDLTKIHTERLWTQDRDGRVGPTDSDPVHFPIACGRFPMVVVTHYYERRPEDGGYDPEEDEFHRSEKSAPADLVMGLVLKRNIPMHQAMVYATEICERCANSMAYELNLGWGYAEGSDQWKEAGVTCPACEYMSIPPTATPDPYQKVCGGVARNVENPEPVPPVEYAVGRSK